jgi:hypothetical protein
VATPGTWQDLEQDAADQGLVTGQITLDEQIDRNDTLNFSWALDAATQLRAQLCLSAQRPSVAPPAARRAPATRRL